MRALITRRVDPAAVELLRARAEVEYVAENRPLPRAYLLEHLREYDAVLATVSERFDAEVLRAGRPRLSIVSNMAAGLDNIDTVEAAALGVRVYNAPAPTVEATADMTLALALALVRRVVPAQRFILDGRWRGWDPEAFLGRTIRGLTWGVCGLGRIGQATACRVNAFGASIIYFDPEVTLSLLAARIPVQRVSLDELLARADILSIHVPLTPDTTHLIGSDQLAAMKRSAFLVNMARGPVVDSAALTSALKAGQIAGAALDVFDPEPLGAEHPILGLPNVLMTPHIGTGTFECRREMAVQAARNIIEHFEWPPR
jgi:glyoxylate reductase